MGRLEGEAQTGTFFSEASSSARSCDWSSPGAIDLPCSTLGRVIVSPRRGLSKARLQRQIELHGPPHQMSTMSDAIETATIRRMRCVSL